MSGPSWHLAIFSALECPHPMSSTGDPVSDWMPCDPAIFSNGAAVNGLGFHCGGCPGHLDARIQKTQRRSIHTSCAFGLPCISSGALAQGHNHSVFTGGVVTELFCPDSKLDFKDQSCGDLCCAKQTAIVNDKMIMVEVPHSSSRIRFGSSRGSASVTRGSFEARNGAGMARHGSS